MLELEFQGQTKQYTMLQVLHAVKRISSSTYSEGCRWPAMLGRDQGSGGRYKRGGRSRRKHLISLSLEWEEGVASGQENGPLPLSGSSLLAVCAFPDVARAHAQACGQEASCRHPLADWTGASHTRPVLHSSVSQNHVSMSQQPLC